MNKLDQLKEITTVVADTGELDAIRRYQPVDATTNPSLLLKVARDADYQRFISDAQTWARAQGGSADEQLRNCIDRLNVTIGREIVDLIPGRVSTEVSARLSFDTDATVAKARRLTALYQDLGVDSDRVLIKIAATWEGVRAAEILEREGINCNMTLIFGFSQAVACADAGAFLISPFVGRIYDWYKNRTGIDYQGADDPGVQSVARIFSYYKSHGYGTIVMGASFRNRGQIEALAGCDRLTISPQLLEELASDDDSLPRALDPARSVGEPRQQYSESDFRWQLNGDAMATEKLAEGIRKFHEDDVALEKLMQEL